MKGLHCPTCHCGDVNPPLRIDTAAPFYPLVVECDRLAFERTAAAKAATRASHAIEVVS